MTPVPTGLLLKEETVEPEASARVTPSTPSKVAHTVENRDTLKPVLTDPFLSRDTPGRIRSASLNPGVLTILNSSLLTLRLEKTAPPDSVRKLME
jgi:hypothetical protein